MSYKSEIAERTAALTDVLNKSNTALEAKDLPEVVTLSDLPLAIAGIRRMRIATGTFFPSEDGTAITVPVPGNPCAVSVTVLDSYEPEVGDIVGASYDIFPWRTAAKKNGNVLYYASATAGIRLSLCDAELGEDGIAFPEISENFMWRAAFEYRWTAYFWESVEDITASVTAGEPVEIDGMTYYGTKINDASETVAL